MNRLSAIAIACAASATAVLGLVTRPAQAVSLGELIRDNGTVQDEYMTFSNFTFAYTCQDYSDPNADCEELFQAGHVRPISPFQIGVGPGTSSHSPGLQINDFFRAEDGYRIDLDISYDVESTRPIQSSDLSFDAVVGSGRVEVTDTVSDMNGNEVGRLFADNIRDNDVPFLADSVVFDRSVTQFQVLKQISMNSEPGTGLSNMTTIDQEYAPVPEPLTILGSAAAFGFGVAFKKEHSRKKNNQK
ncbi:MAG: PEP-CTERM sorting domain-containing protein [Coleofasciculus sp. C1-SOL-03]|uniref:PEP-CTERM sorting domain-containing protein n=1 Tax=Coleofasciculus sp. C1-SOL-03 TaxID=3069522 RepID=UPI0032FB1C72